MSKPRCRVHGTKLKPTECALCAEADEGWQTWSCTRHGTSASPEPCCRNAKALRGRK